MAYSTAINKIEWTWLVNYCNDPLAVVRRYLRPGEFALNPFPEIKREGKALVFQLLGLSMQFLRISI